MSKPRSKITKRLVDSLKPDPLGRDIIYFDTEIRRFGVRVKPSGVKSYVLQYRNKYGRLRRITLGKVGQDFTAEQARGVALKARARIAEGADPADERRSNRKATTVAELCDEYLEASKGRIKPSTLTMDKSRIERHVKPLLGTRAVASLTYADMEKFLRDVIAGKTALKLPADPDGKRKRPPGGQTRGGPGAASRTMGMLGTILERAVRDGALAFNPVRGIPRPKDRVRKPPFSFEDIEAIGRAIGERESEGENVAGLHAIGLLILTGFRRMEALTLTWSIVDRRARCVRFADTKTGPQMRPLGRAALDLLERFRPIEARPSDYVFPGAVADKHLIGLPRVWARVAKRAGIQGVSLHGLRHWFASAAAEMNFSELTIAGLLGHHVKGVTARYATMPDAALLVAADRVSLQLADALDGQRSQNVVSIRG